MSKQTNPVIIGEEMDGKIVHIKFIDGQKYKLQHPGNRAKMRWEKESFNPVSGLDLESFMDKAFEHCVIPDGHTNKPNIDNVKPKELEVWQKLLRRFLEGELEVIASGEKGTVPGGEPRGGKAKDQ